MRIKRERKIRVCIVAASLDILGGQAVQAKRLVEDFAREEVIEADFLPINPRLPGPLHLLQRIKYVRTFVTVIAYVTTLLVRLPRFDVVHIFSASYFSFVIAPTPAILIAKLYGKPVLLNYHSGEAEDHLTRWRRTAIPTLRLADRIVVPSGYLVDVFRKFGLEAKAIFNNVDLSSFRFRHRKPLGAVLLSNRNLEKHYNVACSLRAFALIQKHIPSAKMIVAGSGKESASLKRLASELNLKNIEFVGAMPPERMPALYDRADIFINASDVDNMPLSIIEAFACGLLVVTTDAGGIPYIVEHERNGLIPSRNDPESLARNCIALLEDGGLNERLTNTARNDCRKYTWAEVRNEWIEMYADLAGYVDRPSQNGITSTVEASADSRNG